MRHRPPLPASLPLAVLGVACAACARYAPMDETRAPDLGKRAVGMHGAVTSAHPLASEAGLAMLRAGGNAVDAAVATAFAIGVVEPEMSGVGGGGAFLFWQQSSRHAEYLDFYPSQPVARWRGVRADSGAPLRVVAVPGNVAGLLAAHARFGTLPREQVMAPAIRLASEGFPLYPVLAEFIARDTLRLTRDTIARTLYFASGRALGIGDTLRNAPLAEVLQRIAREGRDGFYRGATAQALVRRMNAGGHPVQLEDVAAYEPQWKRPLCTTYHGRVVLSAPPPMGGLQFLHTLELLESRGLAATGFPTRDGASFDVMASALRVGIVANSANDDPRWRSVPVRGIISEPFAQQWR
ncbi:MAG TPA: gamma-glutamyltransferase, partial [Gemmatimonadaceae bacterium]|nr:gamma-glutamyltransferase [Gemmatimonadaceae bacterium]